MFFKKYIPVLFVLAILLAACSQNSNTSEGMQKDAPTQVAMEKADLPEATTTPMMDDRSKEMMDTPPEGVVSDQASDKMETAAPDTMMDDTSKNMESGNADMKSDSDMFPAWFGMTLVDVSSGESFTINDIKGKVILVETLAQWCPKCLQQQKQVQELHQLIGENPDFVSLGLDIDANEDRTSLKAYIDKNGFTWRYAVAPAEVSREIGNLYGSQFLNPPSTPMFIIDRQGVVHPLPFGVKSAEDLLDVIEPLLKEGM